MLTSCGKFFTILVQRMKIPQANELYSGLRFVFWDSHLYSEGTSQSFLCSHPDFEMYLLQKLTKARPGFDKKIIYDPAVTSFSVWLVGEVEVTGPIPHVVPVGLAPIPEVMLFIVPYQPHPATEAPFPQPNVEG